MPGNIIKINDSIEFYIGDSKMKKLVEFLRKNGHPENKEAKKLIEKSVKKGE